MGGAGVVWFMLVLAIVNLALGYGAALALVEPPLWSDWQVHWLRPPTEPQRGESRVSERSESETMAAQQIITPENLWAAGEGEGPPIVAGFDELPPDWLAQLAVEGIVAQSFVEATAHVLRLEVGRYREQLIVAECRTRSSAAEGDKIALRNLADELRYLNQDWLDKQTAAADMLAQRAGRLGDHEQAASALEQVLLDQAAQIRAACGTLQSIEPSLDVESAGKQLLDQIASLLLHAHSLRDRIIDLLATLIRDGEALETYGATVQRDPATSLPNRIGLESLLSAWWREDEQRTRILSAILIDLDRFGRINQRFGTRTGDRAIAAVVRLIDETLTKDRGFERLVRIGGQSLLILQGDVGPHQALTAAERLRQAIEATTFDDEGTEFDLTISCGVIEVGHAESSLDLVRRAFETLRFAKRAGRNRCALDKGDGPAMLDPPQFPVKGRVVSLRAAALSLPTSPPETALADGALAEPPFAEGAPGEPAMPAA
jgi:diguanylate cyclase